MAEKARCKLIKTNAKKNEQDDTRTTVENEHGILLGLSLSRSLKKCIDMYYAVSYVDSVWFCTIFVRLETFFLKLEYVWKQELLVPAFLRLGLSKPLRRGRIPWGQARAHRDSEQRKGGSWSSTRGLATGTKETASASYFFFFFKDVETVHVLLFCRCQCTIETLWNSRVSVSISVESFFFNHIFEIPRDSWCRQRGNRSSSCSMKLNVKWKSPGRTRRLTPCRETARAGSTSIWIREISWKTHETVGAYLCKSSIFVWL